MTITVIIHRRVSEQKEQMYLIIEEYVNTQTKNIYFNLESVASCSYCNKKSEGNFSPPQVT